MASFKYYLKDAGGNSLTSIYLLFDDSVNRAKLYIKQTIHPKKWNATKGEANKTLAAFADYNQKLKRIKDEVKAIHIKLTSTGTFSTEKLKDHFDLLLAEINGMKISNAYGLNKAIDKITDLVPHYIKSVENIKGKATIGSYGQTLTVLKGYETQKRKRLTFEAIDVDFYYEFKDYLMSGCNYSPNTVGKHIKNLKAFMNEATERGLNTNQTFKSKKFKVESEDADNIYLTESELDRMRELDLSNNLRLDKARDLFLIGCYTGLRFSDFSQLTKSNLTQFEGTECITLKTQKTGEKVTIPLRIQAKAILSKYENTLTGFPLPIANQNLNYYIKEIGEMAGITELVLQYITKGRLKTEVERPKFELIGTHTARRSFATNAFLSGLDSVNIMKITGHRSNKTFLKYIKITAEQNALLVANHWKQNTKLKVA